MKLLILTQAMDSEDPVLGFFEHWVAALAARYEKITVICLREGAHNLPGNVAVLTLGKPASRLHYVARFFTYIRREKNEYDAVFVHMNQEYVLLGGWLWRRWGKKVYLWRNHYAGGALTDRAARWCNKIFCTSKYSYTAKFPKTVIMPVGVDAEAFDRMPEVPRDPRSVLFLGRLAASKRPDVLLSALQRLASRGEPFSAAFYGPGEEAYVASLEARAQKLGNAVSFHPGVRNADTPQIYNRYGIFVNCSPPGMLDKTIFEAMACECLVLASSADLAALVDPAFTFMQDDAGSLAQKLEALLGLSVGERQAAGARLRNLAKEQSLQKLVERLSQEITA